MANSKTINTVKSLANQRTSYKDVFLNIKLWWLPLGLAVLALFIVCISSALSIKFGDWTIFGRCGAITTVIGSYIIARPVWRKRFKHNGFATLMKEENGVMIITDEQFAEYIMERVDVWFFYIGFFIAAIGSLIWGFGDLIN